VPVFFCRQSFIALVRFYFSFIFNSFLKKAAIIQYAFNMLSKFDKSQPLTKKTKAFIVVGHPTYFRYFLIWRSSPSDWRKSSIYLIEKRARFLCFVPYGYCSASGGRYLF
jgi:hypothetical protein